MASIASSRSAALGTLARSIRSLARGGKVCLIGFLAGRDGDTNPTPLMMVGGSLHGIFVGDRGMFEEMNRAIAVNRLKPVIDKVFPFDSAPAAYRAPGVARVCWQDRHCGVAAKERVHELEST